MTLIGWHGGSLKVVSKGRHRHVRPSEQEEEADYNEEASGEHMNAAPFPHAVEPAALSPEDGFGKRPISCEQAGRRTPVLPSDAQPNDRDDEPEMTRPSM